MLENDLVYRFFFCPWIYGLACWLLAYVLAPSQFLKVIYQETNEPYLSIIARYISVKNFKIFFSGVHIYAFRQLISSVAFGFAQWLYACSLKYYFNKPFLFLIIWQSFLVAAIETLFTIHSETQEIVANKGELIQRKAAVTDVITPIFLRNFLVSLAPILAFAFTRYIQNGLWMNIVVCSCCSIILSLLSMPFDLVATQNCGSAVRMSWIGRLKQIIILDKQFVAMFKGGAMRVFQNVVYSIAIGLLMIVLD